MPPHRPDFVLDAQLCFALHTASRAMTACYRPLLEEIGLRRRRAWSAPAG